MPSTRILIPRTPNWERAPNPRIEILSPTAGLYRFWTLTPGSACSASSMENPAFPSTRSRPAVTEAEKGSRSSRTGDRSTDTTMGANSTVSGGSVWAPA